MALARFGVSLDEDILKALDGYVIENNLPNRSQAIRHLVEKNLVEKKWQCNQTVAGAIVLLYEHNKADVTMKLKEVQHENCEVILSSQHFLLSQENCLEIVAVRGKAKRLTRLSDKLIGIKGIIHGKLIMSRVE